MSVEHVAYYDQLGNYLGFGEHQAGQEAGHYTKNVFTFLLAMPDQDSTRPGGLVLQVRAKTKSHMGGLIDVAAGGAVRLLDPHSGKTETNLEAAQREFNEEIGLRLLGHLVLVHTYMHTCPGQGLDGLRRHHTALFLCATDLPLSGAVLQTDEVDELLLLSNEAELRALDPERCVPVLGEELDHIIGFLRPRAGDQDVIEWAVQNWPKLLRELESETS